MLFTVPSIGGFLKKTIIFSGFKNPHKKIRETSKLESIHVQYFVERKIEGRKLDKTRVWEDSSLCPEPSTKNTVLEFHLGTKKIEEEYASDRLFTFLVTGWPL